MFIITKEILSMFSTDAMVHFRDDFGLIQDVPWRHILKIEQGVDCIRIWIKEPYKVLHNRLAD
jgi:hypothetical protein